RPCKASTERSISRCSGAASCRGRISGASASTSTNPEPNTFLAEPARLRRPLLRDDYVRPSGETADTRGLNPRAFGRGSSTLPLLPISRPVVQGPRLLAYIQATMVRIHPGPLAGGDARRFATYRGEHTNFRSQGSVVG